MKLPKIIRERRERLAQRLPQPSPMNATGCICPPTSERTCKNPTCPRQDHRTLGQKMRDSNP